MIVFGIHHLIPLIDYKFPEADLTSGQLGSVLLLSSVPQCQPERGGMKEV